MESEAYLCAARTYTILNQPLAGLLYMEIAMRKKLQQKTSIPYKESFEILWMVSSWLEAFGSVLRSI